jgi:cysteinyl-tRNA synthetase
VPVSEPRPERRLALFNTLTRRVAEFQPARPPDVGMYSCGPTVYAYQHIGNMRAYVFADTLKRALRWKGYRVRHVINITDVGHLTSDADEGDDKLELAARREHRSAWEIAEFYTQTFKDDLARLSIEEPEVWCKATDHIPQMVAFAQALEAAGWCYRLPSGLYFDTSKDPSYGRLARLDLGGQRAGARVEVVEGKRNPADFAIWRTSAPGENRQMEWDSPWGRGAPGWHLECSVMSIEYLGSHFDVHTGGVDHIPVHHTNEIAQSQAYLADGKEWVGWWLHGEFINLKGAKIAKSTGGGVLIGDLVERGYHPLVYRYLLLQAHYRSQLEFSWEALAAARAGLRRLVERFASARSDPAADLGQAANRHLSSFDEAMSDDLNTAQAIAVVSAAAQDERLTDHELTALATRFDSVLGLGLADLHVSDLDLKRADIGATDEEVEVLVAERDQARAAKDFARSDELRTRLFELGVIVEDQPDGASRWRWG